MLEIKIRKLIYDTKKIWLTQGVRAGIEYLLNSEEIMKTKLDVGESFKLDESSFNQFIVTLLSPFGVPELEDATYKENVSKIFMIKDKINKLDKNQEVLYHSYVIELNKCVDDLVVFFNNFLPNVRAVENTLENEDSLDFKVERIKKYYDQMKTLEIDILKYQTQIDELKRKILENEDLKDKITQDFNRGK